MSQRLGQFAWELPRVVFAVVDGMVGRIELTTMHTETVATPSIGTVSRFSNWPLTRSADEGEHSR